MDICMTFGNHQFPSKLSLGPACGVKILTNLGHMDASAPIEDEEKKAELAVRYGVDILADNTITEKSFSFKRWIKTNFPVMLNTVPIYDCFDAMENGYFQFALLEEAIEKHLQVGSDMIVRHPSLTRALAEEVSASSRVIKVTSRGGSQIYRYMMRYAVENPYFAHWDEICKKLQGTGTAIALGLSLRSGSILDDVDEMFLKEVRIAGELAGRARAFGIPVVIEGIGHVRESNMTHLFSQVRSLCPNTPIKTLGPLLSDRMLGNEHINALLGGYCAAKAGAAIIGALFRSEHLGLPNLEEYEESLINYRMLKYVLNMSPQDLEEERELSIARSHRDWCGVLHHSFNPELAKIKFQERNGDSIPDVCTMCGNRCAMKE